MKLREVEKAVSPLLATIILIAVVVSAGLVVYATISGLFGTFSRRAEVQVTNADLVYSSIGTHMSLSVKNIGSGRIVGLRVLLDGVDITGRLMGTNVGTEFYGIMLAYFEIVATEDDVHVKVERLNAQGGVAEVVENTIASKGGRWRYDGSDLQVYRITSDKPVALFTSSIEPWHVSDDDFYSLAGTDLWLFIPAGAGRNGAVFITAYEEGTCVAITDYGDGDDTQEFTLGRGEFWERPDAAEAPGEVWHVQAGKPITVTAGYPENDEYEEVKSPDGMEYYFPLIGDDAVIFITAKADGTHVTVDNLDGATGDWAGSLNKGEVHSASIPATRWGNWVEWTRLYVSADKPVQVLNVDPWMFGASQHLSSDNPSGMGFEYVFHSGHGRYLSIVAVAPSTVSVSGDYSWSGSLPSGGNVLLDMESDGKRLTITSSGTLAICTLGTYRGEEITPIAPVWAVEPGGSTSRFAPLPSGFMPGQRHALTVEAYFEDGSKTSKSVVVS